MSNTYRYNHHSVTHRRAFLIVVGITAVILGAVGFIIYRDISKNGNASVESEGRIVGQVVGDNTVAGLKVDNELFSLELPEDWVELKTTDTKLEKSYSWQSTKENQSSRWIKLYVDRIPADIAVNRLLPVSVKGSALSIGAVSDNCATFTEGGTLDAHEASKLKPSPAQWQEVRFICDLPGVIDNKVGVSAPGEVNSIVMTGASGGEHRYFFVYTDHTIQPNYTILKDAVESFRVR